MGGGVYSWILGRRFKMTLRWGVVLRKLGLGWGGQERGCDLRPNESGCRD